jgi:hypothetical protein
MHAKIIFFFLMAEYCERVFGTENAHMRIERLRRHRVFENRTRASDSRRRNILNRKR